MRDRAYPLFLKAIDSIPEIPSGAGIRIALSGGGDSTGLLGVLLRYRDRRRPDLRLSAGHIHHRIRGVEADEDARFCIELARRSGIPYTQETIDVPALSGERRLSLETAAREARLAVFSAWGVRDRLFAVATGHTRDDQVETVLGNFIRGTGLAGLRGMPAVRRLPGGGGTVLLRPLLGVRRAELSAFCETIGLTTRHDSSNRDLRHRRNRLRRRLLPLVREEFNPAFEEAVLGLAGEAAEIARHRLHLLRPTIEALASAPGIVGVRLAAIAPLLEDRFLLAPLLDHAWDIARGGGGGSGLLRDHHEAWCAICEASSDGSRYHLPGGWRIERSAGWVYLVRGADREPPPGGTPVAVPGRTSLPWTAAFLEVRTGPRGDLPGWTSLSTEWARGAPRMRGARQGDLIAFPGGHADVMEVLRARGIPASYRTSYPVWEASARVVWVPGMRRATLPRGGEGGTLHARLEVLAVEDPTAFLLGRVLEEHHEDCAAARDPGGR